LFDPTFLKLARPLKQTTTCLGTVLITEIKIGHVVAVRVVKVDWLVAFARLLGSALILVEVSECRLNLMACVQSSQVSGIKAMQMLIMVSIQVDALSKDSQDL
jgi:hypothetical protein